MTVPSAQNGPAQGASDRPRDELAEHRERRGSARLPLQRRRAIDLTESDRETYELQLDAYEVQLAEYQRKLDDYASQLEVAHHDGLTGAWLRQAGQQLLEEEIARSDRLGTPLTIAFIDVDALKARNDDFGHAAGDRALLTVARALMLGLRAYDHVIRWGGDEFLCVAPGLAEAEAVGRISCARESLMAEDRTLSISVGIAERAAGEDSSSLVCRADRALYVSRGRHLPHE